MYVAGREGPRRQPRDDRRAATAMRRASCSASAMRRFARGGRAGARREPGLRSGEVPRRAPDAGVLRLRGQQFRCARVARARSCAHSPGPQPRPTLQRTVAADEPKLTGFVFKIQANMDPGHRDRIAFMRLCSGRYAARHAAAPRAARQGGADRRCADLPRRRPQPGRGGLRRRHHRAAQSRHHQHRRHLHRGRGAELHRRAEFRAGDCSGARCSRIRCA